MFRGDDDKLFGTISRTYGDELMVRRIERLNNETDDGSRETQLLLDKDKVSITFVRNGRPETTWSLSANGERFEKLPIVDP